MADSVESLHLRGVALVRVGNKPAGLASSNKPWRSILTSKEAMLNHATVVLDLSRADEGLAGLDRLLSLDPENAVAWYKRGNCLLALGQCEDAHRAYDQALAIDPNFESAKHNRFYALLNLRRVDRIAGFAVREAFNPVSWRYDQMMLVELDYRSHLHLRKLALQVCGGLAPPWDILDLGCGTGLVGDCLKDMAKGGRLDGVDISPAMLEEARKRKIYDELILGDLETVLAADGPSYGVILSADVMVYFGNLAPTLSGVAKRLSRGGAFLFTCEAKEGDGWELTPENRFRHSKSYLCAEAGKAGLKWLALMECTLRFERGSPVAGFAIALRKPEFEGG